MYELSKLGIKTTDILTIELEQKKISPLFFVLASTSVMNHYEFLKIKENSGIDNDEKELFYFESLYFHIRNVISSKIIWEEVKRETKENGTLIKKKLREELDKFSLRNKWLIEESIKEYKEHIEPGRSENIDFCITLILRRTKDDEEKRFMTKKKLKGSFYEGEQNTLKEITKGIKNKKLTETMLLLGSAKIENESVIARFEFDKKCNDIGKNLTKVLAKEGKEGRISQALHFFFVQGLVISFGYTKLIDIKKYEKGELEQAIFETAFFHTRLLIRNKELTTKLGVYVGEREVKKELLKELSSLAVQNGIDMSKPMKEFRDASKKDRSIGEQEYIISRALKLLKQEEHIRELFEFYFRKAQSNSVEEIIELLTKIENTVVRKEEVESLLFRKLE